MVYDEYMNLGPEIRMSATRKPRASDDPDGFRRRRRRARQDARLGRGFDLAHALRVVRPELLHRRPPAPGSPPTLFDVTYDTTTTGRIF